MVQAWASIRAGGEPLQRWASYQLGMLGVWVVTHLDQSINIAQAATPGAHMV